MELSVSFLRCMPRKWSDIWELSTLPTYDFIIIIINVAVVICNDRTCYFVLNFLVQCKAHAKLYTCFVTNLTHETRRKHTIFLQLSFSH